MKEIFVIAGPNGAGKTTTAQILLPDYLTVNEYVNADLLAHALSPFRPETVAIQAGRLMLDRIHQLIEEDKSFAFETTLASRSFVPLLKQCKAEGYKINLIFLWLHSVELAIQRVKFRVEYGGHAIPIETIARRYKRGLENLFGLYMPIVNHWSLYDNSGSFPEIISEKKFFILLKS